MVSAGIVRRHLAFDQAKTAGARTCEIEDGFDRKLQYRSFHRLAASGAKHRLRFGVLAKQPAIDQRRQILATLGGTFETAFDCAV